MLTLLLPFALGVVMTFTASASMASDIPGSCLVTFNVRDKTFTSGTSTMSCRALESRRVALFSEINALPKSGSVSGADVANRLGQLEQRLGKLESETNWTGLATSVSGNFLATLGLAACLETAGAGCAVSVVGKLVSLVDVVDSAVSDAQKAKETADVRREISAIKQEIAALNPPAGRIRDRLVADFNGLCSDVNKHCLSD